MTQQRFSDADTVVIGQGSRTPILGTRLLIDLPSESVEGIAIDIGSTPGGANERAGIKIGDFSIVQDPAKTGSKSLGIMNSDGSTALTLVGSNGAAGALNDLYQTAIPLIFPPTYNMGNNGAITAMSTLPAVYPACYIWIPINGITASTPVAAGWYYAEMSSTTAGTLYNNTWDGVSSPTVPTTKTAFVTTGPGAVTGPTAEALIAAFPIPAALGRANTAVNALYQLSLTNNANAKTLKQRFTTIGGTALHSLALTSAAAATADLNFNLFSVSGGTVTKQTARGYAVLDTAIVRSASIQTAEATNAAWSLGLTLTKATATDSIVIEYLRVLAD